MADGKVWATELNVEGRDIARRVPCPQCNVPAHQPCRTRKGGGRG